MEFFSESDLNLVSEWGNKDYNPKDRTHQKIGESLKLGPSTKTKFWVKKTAGETDFTFKSVRNWLKRGLKFRPYTWGRIWDDSTTESEVYFTLGINGDKNEPYLHIKLDYQFETPKYLNSEQQSIARKHLRPHGEAKFEKKILLNKLSIYNWDKLIAESVKFIENHKDQYYDIVEEINRRDRRYFTRICWNTQGWRQPSGPAGKSKNKSTFEGITGIGHEEWLFSDDFKFENYQYGFLQAKNLSSVSGAFDVDLYTLKKEHNGLSQFYVASIKNVEVLTQQQIEEFKGDDSYITDFIKNNTTVEQRKSLLAKFPDYKKAPVVNIRFKIDDAIYPEEDDLVPINLDTKKFHRYQLHKGALSDYIDKGIATDADAQQGLIELSDSGHERGDKRTRTVYSSAGSYQSRKRHIKLSEKLESYLNTQKSNGDSIIAERGLGQKSVDMVWETPNEFIFYEIKTFANVSRCIRDALGQLLEYAFYRRPEVDKDYQLIITSPHEPDQWVEEYMELLRDRFDIPIHYQQFDMEEGVLKELI